MDPITWAVLLGGASVGKELLNEPQRQKQREINTANTRYGAYTGMRDVTPVQDPNYLASAVQGGLQGAAFGQNLQAIASWKDFLNRQGDYAPVAPSQGKPIPFHMDQYHNNPMR